MYRPLPKCLTIKESNIEGLGLFSTEDIKIGTNLGVSHIKDDNYENGLIRTPLGGFFNHNPHSPNCEVLHGEKVYYLCTIKDIKKGEELTAKYTIYDPSN